jgi:caa(3)-type oxidase subunit IV
MQSSPRQTTAAHSSTRLYVAVYGALLVLATASWLLARLHTPLLLPLAIGIGAIKALLVLRYFMHLGTEPFSFKLAIASAGILVLILVALTTLDVLSR